MPTIALRRRKRNWRAKGSGWRAIGKEDYQAKGVMYLPPKARFSSLLALPEGEIGGVEDHILIMAGFPATIPSLKIEDWLKS
jgi:hypothetical protein